MNRRSGTTNMKVLVGVLVGVAVVVAAVAVMKLNVLGSKGSGLGKQFKYDIEKLAHVDPNLILYEESADPIDTGLAASHSIAADSQGSIYVAGDKAVRRFAASGDSLAGIELAAEPRCLTVAADGNVYIGFNDHVEVYTAQGQLQASWDSLGPDAILTSIAVWQDDVFVADAGNRVVVRFDTTGKLVSHIGKKDPDRNVPGFVIPSAYFDLVVSKDGLLRVVDPGRLRIEAYTFDGDFEFSWGRASVDIEGFCGCCNPVNIAVLPDGGFVTCEKGLIRVKIYSAEGAFTGVVAGPEQLAPGGALRICMLPEECQAGGFDVAVDANGRVLVLDTIKNVVRIFTRVKG
ncbi:MAG: NHL repeat-containing protein [Planctomycetota bacterium]